VVAILTGHDEYFSLDAEVLKGLMGQERPMVVNNSPQSSKRAQRHCHLNFAFFVV
jgi:hypothetical protein